MPRNPLILGFDTSAAHVAAALVSGDQIVAEHFEELKKGQDQVLFPTIEAMLNSAGVDWSDLTAIGVGVGPGNFTGVRISVAAAKGLSLALDIPAFGVSMFDALRYGITRTNYAAVPAPRGAAYVDAGQGTAPILAASPADIDPHHSPKAEPVIVGHVDASWADALHSQPVEPRNMCATAIAFVAGNRLLQQKVPEPPKPLYIKSPDAAPPRHPAPQIVP